MRKLLVVVFLVALTTTVFAEDALVLPKGVIRARVVVNDATIKKEFDGDAEKVDLLTGADSISAVNVGGAIEYGVTDQITAAVQWVPGYTLWSKVDVSPSSEAKVNGAYDLFVGAKAQIMGEQGFMPNDTMRVAAGVGVIVPLPGPDWQEQADNAGAGDAFILADADLHALGLGARLYFDYVVLDDADKDFFVNLYSEFGYFFPADKESLGAPEAEFNYGYRLTAELEPQYAMNATDGLRLTFGLPVTYVTMPESEVNGTSQDDESYSLSIRPRVAVMLLGPAVKPEFELGYSTVLMGKNSMAANALVFQAKVHLKF